MSMRKQLTVTVESILESDERTILLLGDIGVFGFRNALEKFPHRVYNIGILEPTTIGLSSGLAMQSLIPIVHTIAPFITERSLEQLKDDFCFQKLGGNFISVGASYDYAALGPTHHCPGDIGALNNLPGMEIIVPGTSGEFDRLFRQTYADNSPTYHRLSENENDDDYPVNFGRAEVIKKGRRATAIAVGPMLNKVVAAGRDLDITILYYTTIKPFDHKTLSENCESGKILLCEPYYSGVLSSAVLNSLYPRAVMVDMIGVPDIILPHYGTPEQQDEYLGLTIKNFRERLNKLIAI